MFDIKTGDVYKLVVSKIKDETDGVVIEKFVRLKPKMYSFLKDDSSEHKKAKDVNKGVVATSSRNEFKDVLLNQECLRQSMNRIESKNKSLWNNKISLSHIDDEMYILKYGYDGLAPGY